MSGWARRIISTCINSVSLILTRVQYHIPPCRYKITRSFRLGCLEEWSAEDEKPEQEASRLAALRADWSRCHVRVPTTHSPESSLRPSSAASNSASMPRRPRLLTWKVTGVTSASEGTGTRPLMPISSRIIAWREHSIPFANANITGTYQVRKM